MSSINEDIVIPDVIIPDAVIKDVESDLVIVMFPDIVIPENVKMWLQT